MKSLICAAALILLVGVSQSDAGRCARSIRQCDVINAAGREISVEYDNCLQICCGRQLYDRDVDRKCCGTAEAGVVYNTRTQVCCGWQYGGVYNVYNNTQDASCCGDSLYFSSGSRRRSCCAGWPGQPKVFNSIRQMCCDGVVTNAANTAFTSCCGSDSFDRRVASCPCNNARVVRVPARRARCCRGAGGLLNPYNYDTQGCCNGRVFDKETQVCCGNRVGNSDTHMCCGGLLIRINNEDPGLACCVSRNGSHNVYDPRVDVCCEGFTYNRANGGESCCGQQPYFSNTTACCDGMLSNIVTGRKPSCCGRQAFDYYLQTCCGTRVYNNPMFQLTNWFTVSHNTRCCGVASNSRPYDLDRQACCSGDIIDLGSLPAASAGCCGNALYNKNEARACCGDVIINSTQSVCCAGVASQRLLGNTECCGSTTMNSDLSLCCNGVPRSLNGIAKENAICCGEGCIDGSTFYCCDGKQYQKGVGFGLEAGGLNCDVLAP